MQIRNQANNYLARYIKKQIHSKIPVSVTYYKILYVGKQACNMHLGRNLLIVIVIPSCMPSLENCFQRKNRKKESR